jgi:hypothetical protein
MSRHKGLIRGSGIAWYVHWAQDETGADLGLSDRDQEVGMDSCMVWVQQVKMENCVKRSDTTQYTGSR